MSETSLSLESTRHCVSARRRKGTLAYVAVAAVALMAWSTSDRHPQPEAAQTPVADLSH